MAGLEFDVTKAMREAGVSPEMHSNGGLSSTVAQEPEYGVAALAESIFGQEPWHWQSLKAAVIEVGQRH